MPDDIFGMQALILGNAFLLVHAGEDDAIGHPHGEALRLTERFRRRDFGHIDLQITIDDPEWYEKPWTVSVVLEMTPDTELLEDVCLENERDVRHMVGK